MRRAIFGRHGRKVIGGLCGFELLALLPGSPLPTISSLVEKKRVFGVALLALLAQHWFLEAHEVPLSPTAGGAFGTQPRSVP